MDFITREQDNKRVVDVSDAPLNYMRERPPLYERDVSAAGSKTRPLTCRRRQMTEST